MRTMMGCAMLSVSVGAVAQEGLPAASPARDACADMLVVGGESYRFSAGGGGQGASVDGQRCLEAGWSALAGASTYDVADSRWSIARLGATTRRAAGHVAFGTATAGSGRNANGRFAYRKLSAGLSFKAAEALHLKAEHEYFDVDENRGNVGKLGFVARVTPQATVDVTAASNLGGNLPTRAVIARADAIVGGARLYAGMGYGRLLPQVRDIATGERAPDVVSREVFAGAALRLPLGELIAAADTVRTAGSRRDTYTLAWQVPLP